MADAAKKIEEEPKATDNQEAPKKKAKGPLIMGILLTFNTLCLVGVGIGVYHFVNKIESANKKQTIVNEDDLVTPSELEAKVVSLEPLIVNLSGSEGYKLLKVSMSMQVENVEVQEEISKRQAQVRDIILLLLSSKTYGEISGEDAKQQLKEDIMDTVNSFLTSGRVQKILFTEFLFN